MSHSVETGGVKQPDGSSIAKWTLWSLAALVLILWVEFGLLTQNSSGKNKHRTSQSESNNPESKSSNIYPDQYSVNYYLRFGQETKVNVPRGFDYDIPPDGPNEDKVYQMAVKDGEFHLTGSGLPHQNQGDNVTYFRLKAAEKQLGITVIFKRNK